MDVRMQARAAEDAALVTEAELARMIQRLTDARDGLWSEVRASVEVRLDAMASDLDGYRALDASLDGALGVDRYIRKAREAHADAIRRKEAFDVTSGPVARRMMQEHRQEVLRRQLDEAASYEEKVERLKKQLADFDPAFVSLKRLVDAIPDGPDRDAVRSPSLISRLFNPKLDIASTRLKRYEASTGKSFYDVLEKEYEPLDKALREAKARLSLSRDTGHHFRQPGHRERMRELEDDIQAQKLEAEIAVAGAILDNIDRNCRAVVVDGVRLVMESFDRRLRNALAPVRTDDLDALARIGLLGREDIVTVVRRAGIGTVLGLAESQEERCRKTVGSLRLMQRLDGDFRHEGRLRTMLDLHEFDHEKDSEGTEIVRQEVQRVLTEQGPHVPEDADTTTIQRLVLEWATSRPEQGMDAVSEEFVSSPEGPSPLSP